MQLAKTGKKAHFNPVKRLVGVGLLSALSFSSSYASGDELCREPELNVNGLSRHFYQSNYSRKEGWNERNIGLGFTCHLNDLGEWNSEFEGGFLKNSHRKTAFYGGYGVYYPLNPTVSAGIRVMVASGYKSYIRTHGIIGGPMPTVKFHLDKTVTLNLSIAPKVNSFVFAALGLKF